MSVRLYTAHGVPMPRGGVEIDVGAYVISIAVTPHSAVARVVRKDSRAIEKNWAAATHENIVAAIEYAANKFGPACVEDASGACVNPLHNHDNEGATR